MTMLHWRWRPGYFDGTYPELERPNVTLVISAPYNPSVEALETSWLPVTGTLETIGSRDHGSHVRGTFNIHEACRSVLVLSVRTMYLQRLRAMSSG
jgi:hypothetical protein